MPPTSTGAMTNAGQKPTIWPIWKPKNAPSM